MRLEAVITQLVFENALRMRVKAGVSDAPATATTTPDAALVVEISADGSMPTEAQSASSTLVGGADPIKGKQKDKDDGQAQKQQSLSKSDKDSSSEQNSKNVVGRINNLITTDLAALAFGQVALYLGKL